MAQGINPIRVKAPDGSIVEFPEGTSREVMRDAMRRKFGGPEPVLSAQPGGFDDFQAMLKRGEIKGVNSGGTLADVGQQFRGGLVQGAAGAAIIPERAGQWLGEKAVTGIDYLMGREHQPLPRVEGFIPSPGDVAQYAVDAMALPEARTAAGDYANVAGQFLPSIVAGGPVRITEKAARAISGALGFEAAGKATEGTWAEPFARFAGAVAGGLAPDALRRVATPFPVNAERQRLLGVLDKEAIPLTAGQRTGRTGLKVAESEFGGGRAADIMEQQAEKFTAAALRRAGVNARRATPEVMDEAFSRLGSQFDDLAGKTAVPLDGKLQNDLLSAVVDYQNIAASPSRAAEQIINRISELASKNGNILAGDAYKEIQSAIAKLMRSNNADAGLKETVGNIREALDDAVERNLSGDLLASWRKVRREYRNLKTIEQAATVAGESAAEGILSPSALRSATVRTQGRGNYARGKGDLADLARAGEAVMKPLPQLASANRAMLKTANATLPALLGSIAGRATGIPGGEIVGALLGTAAPFAQGRVLMSKPVQTWLANQKFAGPGVKWGQRVTTPLLGAAGNISQK